MITMIAFYSRIIVERKRILFLNLVVYLRVENFEGEENNWNYFARGSIRDD